MRRTGNFPASSIDKVTTMAVSVVPSFASMVFTLRPLVVLALTATMPMLPMPAPMPRLTTASSPTNCHVSGAAGTLVRCHALVPTSKVTIDLSFWVGTVISNLLGGAKSAIVCDLNVWPACVLTESAVMRCAYLSALLNAASNCASNAAHSADDTLSPACGLAWSFVQSAIIAVMSIPTLIFSLLNAMSGVPSLFMMSRNCAQK